MATVINSHKWDRPSMASTSSHTSPSVFPERPIRPLPKRRLRARLSSEQADSIVYPLIPPSSSPLFGSPQSPSERSFIDNRYSNRDAHGMNDDHDHVCDCGGHHSGLDSEDEEDDPDAHQYTWSGNKMRFPGTHAPITYQYRPPPPNSSTSSADGYESFENTNNKKKRKIPNSGALAVSAMSGEAAEANQRPDFSHSDHVRSSALHGSGVGLSGPGRGRYSRSLGRPMHERRPLTNTYANGNVLDRGIISTAMANAKDASTHPTPRGQENVATHKPRVTTEDSQTFTFECKSDSSEKMAQSGRPLIPSMHSQALASPHGTASRPAQVNANNGPGQYSGNQASSALQPAPKPRKTKQEIFESAARRRRAQKQLENYHNPPSPSNSENNYICYICEYEDWFGETPRILMRAYETRDHRERKAKEANRRRLEQAKAKSRKGKKSRAGNKNSNNATTTPAQVGNGSQPYDPAKDYPIQDDGSQGDEFFEDEDYDDAAQERGQFEDEQYSEQANAPVLHMNGGDTADMRRSRSQ